MKNLALSVFVIVCSSHLSAQCDHPDYPALISIYNALAGENWVFNGGWVEGAAGNDCEVCDWDYVFCNNDDRVTSFSSFSNGYNGTIPMEIGELEFLESINLSYGTINGELPNELFQLNNLKSLRLTDVNLNGEIPTSIGNLTNLENLYLDNNNLTGAIPESIGNCTKLKKLFLNTNSLTGVIPSSINNFTSIEWIELTRNQFEGPLPDVTSGGMLNINEFDISNNNISGSIPSSFGNLINPSYLGLSNNMLEGCIPNSLMDLCSYTVNFENNPNLEGTGVFSDFCSNGSGACQSSSINEVIESIKIRNTLVNDFIYIDGNLDEEANVVVSNMDGKFLINSPLSSQSNIDLSSLRSGIYFVTFITKSASFETIRIYKY